jgi:uncharacterized membrane protein required for colicin V production
VCILFLLANVNDKVSSSFSFQAKWLSMLEETRQRFKLQLQKEVSAQSQITQESYEKEKNPFYESGIYIQNKTREF